MARILYVTYDGLLEPLGQSQVWQYVRRLSADHAIHILSFEKASDYENAQRMTAMRRECARAGVGWTPLRYHKTPTMPATAFDIAAGTVVGLALVLRHRLHIVHARSYVAALIALTLKRIAGTRFLFDMRGFWADERVEGGLWRDGALVYRVAKRLEKSFLLHADAVVSLTHAAVSVMRDFDYLRGRAVRFEVIPTCADLALFSPSEQPATSRGFTLGYVGSVGVWYLFEEVLATFRVLSRLNPDARLLVINRGDHDKVRAAAQRAGIAPDIIEIVAADHHEVPDHMRRMDASAFFYKPAFSRAATAPTKLAEFLGVGIPVLVNAGVGDMARIVQNDGQPVGVVIGEFSAPQMKHAVQSLLKLASDVSVKRACRDVAERHFSVVWGSTRYSGLYRELAPAATQ